MLWLPRRRHFFVVGLITLAALLAITTPGYAALYGQQAKNDAINVYYQFNYIGRPVYWQVYIDTDQSISTGYNYRGIGANFLVENGSLFRYTGTGAAWSWALVKNIGYVNSNGTVKWTVARADIGSTGCPNTDNLIFETNDSAGNLIDVSAIYTQAIGGCIPLRTARPIPTFTPPQSQYHMAVAAYFYPEGPGCATNCYWTQMGNAAPIVGLAVANPDSGPGTSIDSTYVAAIQAAQAKGLVIVGYVATNYGAINLATVKSQVDTYYSWYHVDGIFFDEAEYRNCTKQSYYQDLYNYVKAKGGIAKVVINPGTTTLECYITTADIILNYEDSYADYVAWTLAGWETKYPANRFWHIIYHAADQTAMLAAVSLAKQRNVGWIYVTDDYFRNINTDNPYDSLPTGTYWTSELSAIQGP